jgi:hypothetical protein
MNFVLFLSPSPVWTLQEEAARGYRVSSAQEKKEGRGEEKEE